MGARNAKVVNIYSLILLYVNAALDLLLGREHVPFPLCICAVFGASGLCIAGDILSKPI